jgi:hypothetical protein
MISSRGVRRQARCDAVVAYMGRADLLDLAVATCLELRREQGEFDLMSHDEAESVRGIILLDRCERLSLDLEAMKQAMDSDTRQKLREAIERLPSPAKLVHGT